jgi:hypothetical protein
MEIVSTRNMSGMLQTPVQFDLQSSAFSEKQTNKTKQNRRRKEKGETAMALPETVLLLCYS